MAISTGDFSLFHDLVRLLRDRDEPFITLSPNEEVPATVSVLITAPGEGSRHHRVVSESDARTAVLKALWLREGLDDMRLIIGVDPGARPGYALTANGRVLESGTVSSPEELQCLVGSTIDSLSPRSTLLRIGHGDPLNRDRSTRCLWPLVDEVQVVDESRTSGKSPTDHIAAAESISRTEGVRLETVPELLHSPGALREIQRVSRRVSGDVTITTALAEDVAHGRLSMEQAIESQRVRASERRPGSS